MVKLVSITSPDRWVSGWPRRPQAPASSRDSVNCVCRIEKKSRNGMKLQIALFNLWYHKEDKFEKNFNVPSHSVEILILLKINGAQLQLHAASSFKLELTVFSCMHIFSARGPFPLGNSRGKKWGGARGNCVLLRKKICSIRFSFFCLTHLQTFPVYKLL